jgi:chitin deacetylase
MRHYVAKRKRRRILRGLIFITLVAATCSFIIGLAWPLNQRVAQMMRSGDAVPQVSPIIPVPPEIASNPASGETQKHRVRGVRESQLFPTNPKRNITIQAQSLNPDIRGDGEPPLVQVVKTPSVQVDSKAIPAQNQKAETLSVPTEIPGWEQQRETLPFPTEFQAKVIKDVKPVRQEKAIALTFDDGPWPGTTLQVLEILKKNDIKATFFWIGQNLQAYPQLAKQVVAEGHAIANHTWHHWYHRMNPSTAAREIDDTAKLIFKTTGVKTSVFRPPGGLLNNGVGDYAKKEKYVTVMWSVDSIDYRPLSSQSIYNNVIRKVKPGAIVLMHDGGGNRSATVQALPRIIAKLKEQGYSFLTVPELLDMNDTKQSEVIAKKQLSDSPTPPKTKP